MTRRILPSARKHGIADADILHAIRFALITYDYEDEDRILYLGPDTAANLLEVISLVGGDDGEIGIHAMAMQAKYKPLLREYGEPDA